MQDASRRAKTVDADGPVMIAKPWMYFSKFGSPHLTSVRIAALLAGIILATGCGDSSQDEDFSGETGPITYRERDPILIALQSAGNWELAPVQATLHDPNDEWNDEWGLTSEQAAALAEADMTWYTVVVGPLRTPILPPKLIATVRQPTIHRRTMRWARMTNRRMKLSR